MSIPEDVNDAKLAVLLELSPGTPHTKSPDFKMTVNGVSRNAAIEGGDSTWFWVTSDLDKGNNRVECSIRFAGKEKGNVSFWLMGDRELTGKKIRTSAGGRDVILPAKPYPASVEKVFTSLAHYKMNTN
jgi:hypothetical protein